MENVLPIIIRYRIDSKNVFTINETSYLLTYGYRSCIRLIIGSISFNEMGNSFLSMAFRLSDEIAIARHHISPARKRQETIFPLSPIGSFPHKFDDKFNTDKLAQGQMKFVYVGIADNSTILNKKISKYSEPDSILIFLSKINYNDFPIKSLINFIKLHIFIPRLEDFEFAIKNGKNPKYTLLSSLLIRNKFIEITMDNYSKYIITNCPILENNELKDIKPKRFDGWAKKYDGRFGYAITQHSEATEVIYHKYAVSLNHKNLQKLDGQSTNTIIEL